MRTDDINALAGQRADKKGGVAVRCDDLMANDGGKLIDGTGIVWRL